MFILELAVIDPDTKKADQAAKTLTKLFKQKSIIARPHIVTCYLEIARRNLSKNTPAIEIGGKNYHCKNFSPDLLQHFVNWYSDNVL